MLLLQVERNTVWRDMVAMERRTVAATLEPTVGLQRRLWCVTRCLGSCFSWDMPAESEVGLWESPRMGCTTNFKALCSRLPLCCACRLARHRDALCLFLAVAVFSVMLNLELFPVGVSVLCLCLCLMS